jgi:FKBP-type peptidyl-prolyl cis-trans isomerase
MIKGYDEAVSLLDIGGKGIFIIPYFNAYGKGGRPPVIPVFSDLVFEVELLSATPAPEPMK